MEARPATTPPPGPGSPSSSTAYPRWVLLETSCNCKSNLDSCSNAVAAAAARTGGGYEIQVSLRLAEPPAASAVLFQFPPGRVETKHALPDDVRVYSHVMAAHSASLLIKVVLEDRRGHRTYDYFVYDAGDADADPPRPPSLSLLPPYFVTEGERGLVNRYLANEATGILRRRLDDEIVVAELKMVAVSASGDTPELKTKVAQLVLFRSGEWSTRRPRIIIRLGDRERDHGNLASRWKTDTVVPVGGKTLCWANLSHGVMLCDVLEESPRLQYVPLPAAAALYSGSRAPSRNVCATAGGALRFVNIYPRCCCCGGGASDCRRSRHAYVIKTWTLRMDDDGDMGNPDWVMDGMVDSTELWALDAHKGLPVVPLDYPIVSMMEPYAICLLLCHYRHVIDDGDRTLWLPMVDMSTKTIRSVSVYPRHYLAHAQLTLIPSTISYYLNSRTTCSSHGTSKGQGPTNLMDNIGKIRDGDSKNSQLQSSCKSSAADPALQSAEMLAALQEIPSYGLDRDDMLKAYVILSCDNGRRFRSLLKLPMNLRKDWLLMEIKAQDAGFIGC